MMISHFLHSFKVDIPGLWKNCKKNNFFQYRSLVFVSIDYMKYISDVSMGDFMLNDDFLVFYYTSNMDFQGLRKDLMKNKF